MSEHMSDAPGGFGPRSRVVVGDVIGGTYLWQAG
jgi:hypothetical protein